MGIYDIYLLKPEGYPAQDVVVIPPTPEPELFTVGAPDSNGVFTISGPAGTITITSGSTFTLNAPQVTDHGDGSYTATSA